MDGVRIIPAGGGEVVGDGPERRVEILADGDALHATWSRFAAGRDGADLHVHHAHTDVFYVLAGELTLRLGHEDTQVPVAAGTLALLPPHVVHGFRNASGGELRYLNLHAPGRGFADFLRGLRDGAHRPYDQHDPPTPEEARPSQDAAVAVPGRHERRGGHEVEVLADAPGLWIAEVRGDGEAPGGTATARYVLDGALRLGGAEADASAGAWIDGAAPALDAGSGARWLEFRAGPAAP